VNALSVYGQRRRVGQHRVAALAGTSDDGSDHHDLIRAIDALGYGPAEFESDCPNEARWWLLSLAPLMPMILCIDRWAHWVAVTGWCGSRAVLVDGDAVGDLVQHVAPAALLKRWRAARAQRSEGGLYYGIAVVR
jgi:ABC-type bacteriocin/lantibiotic exporter with double-glycine peptidase domain